MNELELNLSNIISIEDEEKRLKEEYNLKLAALKKMKKERESVGQVFAKGLLPIYVLYMLSLGPTNGNEIANNINEHTGKLWFPSTGGIYPLLKKFEKEGLIVGEWSNPETKFQKIYNLTEKGYFEFNIRKSIFKPRIEESLNVFNIVYSDLYK